MKQTKINLIGLLFLVLFFSNPVHSEINEELLSYIKALESGEALDDHGLCGFHYQILLHQNREELKQKYPSALAKILTSPTRSHTYQTPGGHFIFYYDTSDDHAIPTEDMEGNGVPDYLDSAAVIFDQVWEVEIEQLGFQRPLDPEGNRVDQYPIYFTKLPSTSYGQTIYPYESVPNIPSAFSSYIEINTSLDNPGFFTDGFDALRVTAAHEFNHAIQLGYRVWENSSSNLIDLFLMEMTSTWMEEYVYDSVNDYDQYLSSLFSLVQRVAFTYDNGVFPYGNSLYLQMLERLYGAQTMVDIWERIKEQAGLEALDHVLNQKGSSWARSQNRYGKWLYYTGSRTIPGMFFPEAERYPMLLLKENQKFIMDKSLTFDYSISARSMELALIENSFDIRYRTVIQNPENTGYYSHSSFENLDAEPTSMEIAKAFYPGPVDSFIAIFSNPQDDIIDISYRIEEDTLLVPGIGPDPIYVSSDEDVAWFYNIPAGSTIKIFNLNGRYLHTLKTGDYKEERLSWDLRDAHNQKITSGIYLYILTISGEEKVGKFAVIRK